MNYEDKINKVYSTIIKDVTDRTLYGKLIDPADIKQLLVAAYFMGKDDLVYKIVTDNILENNDGLFRELANK